ncbi:MAG: hypothetical protein ACRDJF_13220 [Actinomycetota bacterium]
MTRSRPWWILATVLQVGLMSLAAFPGFPSETTPGQAAESCSAGAPVTSGDATITIRHAPDTAGEQETRRCTPREGAVLRGPWTNVVDAQALTNLKAFSVSIVPQNPSVKLPSEATVSRSYATPLLEDPNQTKAEDTITYTWDTTTLTRSNGVYRITAVAESQSAYRVETFVADLKVDNPPSKPSAPRVVLDGATPVVTWQANPEPDVTAYRILRSTDAKPYVPVGATAPAEFRDQTAPQGADLRYQVVAARSSPVTKATGIISSPSDPSPPLRIAPGTGVPPAIGGTTLLRSNPQSRTTNRGSTGTAFAPVLPYDSPPPQEASEPSAASKDAPRAISLPQDQDTRTRPTSASDKMRFLAISLNLIVAGLLVARFARQILASA